jgi:cobalt transport protein ATP-binding subunit
MIEIVDLNFHYPDGKSVLERINLSINPGEKVALVGPNGAGKSTLLLHLNGILQGEGLIKINGIELTKKNLPQIRARVGMIFQNPDDQLFSLTVAEDVAYGPLYQGFPSDEIEEKVKTALQAVHLEGFENRHPFHLSGGEKKRASIATVLSMNPDFLVLDEPTAGLDPKSRCELIALLSGLPQTQIIATHDLPMVREIAERVILLNHGRIVADGSVESILTNQNLLIENDLI